VTTHGHTAPRKRADRHGFFAGYNELTCPDAVWTLFETGQRPICTTQKVAIPMARNRSTAGALTRLLSESSLPVYVLDGQRHLVYCNPACAEWTGIDAAQLIGARCDYHSLPQESGGEAAAAGLCPPPEVFGGQRASAVVSCHRATGELSRRWATFVPLARSEENAGVIAVVDSHDLPDHEPVASSAADEPTPAEIHQRLLAFRRDTAAPYRISQLVGDSALARRVRAQVALAVQSDASALIVGPRGSGREHVARTIHYGDSRLSAGRLLPVACPLFDAELLQTTIRDFKRRPAESPGQRPGSVMLLDVDQLPADAQNELAGFLNLPDFSLRTIATSRHPLLELAAEGQFRRDLAFALSTLVIELPALADRAEDMPLLAQLFLEEVNAAGGTQFSGFTSDVLDQFAAYPWPGNLDELADFVRQACQRAAGPLIAPADLPERIKLAADAQAFAPRPDETIVLDDFLAEIEAELIRRALARAKGNKTRAAELLGTNRARLLRRMTQIGLAGNDESDANE
jgi:transcriptional regulator with PAS, ATPase and Fis domain